MTNLTKITSTLALLMVSYLSTLQAGSNWIFHFNRDIFDYNIYLELLQIFTLSCVYLVFIFIIIINILTGRLKLISFIISMFILYAGVIITIDIIFKLQDTTTFILFDLYHPIPLQWKLTYFINVFDEAIKNKYPNLNLKEAKLAIRLVFAINDPLTHIQNMNTLELDKYVHDLISQIDVCTKGLKIVFIIGFINICLILIL